MALQGWCQILQAVAPQAGAIPHAWICETLREGEGRLYEVLSEEKYRDLASKNSWWSTTCTKLSLEKIIEVSRYRLNELPPTSKFLTTLEVGDTFSADFDAEKLLALFQEETTYYPRIVKLLDKMCQRSAAKHAALKTQGIWGKIKFFIWSWFYDRSSWVESMKRRADSFEGSLNKEKACNEIKFRIFVNIDSFEQSAAIIDGRYTSTIDENDYQTPKDVNKKWITKYAADRYDPKSGDQLHLDAIDTSRKRILVLNKLWQKLIDYQPKSDLLPPVEQTLLLPGTTGPQAAT